MAKERGAWAEHFLPKSSPFGAQSFTAASIAFDGLRVKVQERVKRVDTFVRDIMQPDEAGPFDELLPWANMSTNLAGDYQVPNLQQ